MPEWTKVKPSCPHCGSEKVHNSNGGMTYTSSIPIAMIECSECKWTWNGYIDDDGLVWRQVKENMA